MARRRARAPQAAAGDVWRQQQQLETLARALHQVQRGDALPLVLLRGLQRALACVDHTIWGLPACGEAAGGGGGVGNNGHGGPLDGRAIDAAGAGSAAGAAATKEVAEPGAGGGGSVAVAEAQHRGSPSTEAVAASRAAAILRDQLSLVSSGGGGGGSDGGNGGGGDGCCGAPYAAMLLHNYLALSSDLLDVDAADNTAEPAAAGGPAATAGTGGCGAGWPEFRRDELAAAARPPLPAGVYARMVTAMGWEVHLLGLLSWVPDPDAVAPAALARVVRLHPAMAPALAVALLNATDCRASHSAGASQIGAAASTAELGRDTAGPPPPWYAGWARRVASSPGLVRRLAQIVRQAAAEASGGASTSASDGRRWLPCLLLLGRALAEEVLRRRPPAGTATAAVPMETDDCAGGIGWAEECCEALQEGLCAYQADILASGPAVTASEDAGRTAAEALLELLQGELTSLLDAQRGSGGGGGVAAGSRRVLSDGAILRLRSRIMLLGMQSASLAAAAASPPAPPCGVPSVSPTSGSESARPPPGAEVAAGGAARHAAEDVWRDLPCGSADAGLAGRPPVRSLPGWLEAAAATAVPPTSLRRPNDGAGTLQLLLSHAAAAAAGSQVAAPPPPPPPSPPPAAAPGPALTAQAAAIAVALLTPGVRSWLRVQHDPRVISAAGPNAYSSFRVALALLELLQGLGPRHAGSDGADPNAAGRAAVAATMGGAGSAAGAASRGGAEMGPANAEAGQQLELRVLRMAAECLACVGAPEQQAALQEVVLHSPAFASLRARLAADSALQAAAGRALVALSNRAAAVEGSLERMALSVQQEAARLAAAATDLLPYAVLVPEACVRRLVLDGLTHPGQQPWVLQLLRCFAVGAAAPAAVAAPVLLVCVRDVVLGDPARWLRTAAERRSLTGLLTGLLRGGLLAPRQLLLALVEPGLSGVAGDGRRPIAQVHCACLVAQLILGGPGAADPPAAAANSPMVELSAARPARLLLAVAAALGELYDAYAVGQRLEAAAIDIAAAVLERAVQLCGTHVSASAWRADGAGAPALGHEGDARELLEMSEGCGALPRRLVAVLLPLLELAASSQSSRGGSGGGDGAAGGGGDGDDASADCTRTLAALFAPAIRWRPRSLRAADASFARAALYDALEFATSTTAHMFSVRQALLDAAADAAGDVDADDREARAAAVATAAPSVWSAWGQEVMCDDNEAGPAAGAVARHVVATVARGLPQMPTARLLEGTVEAVAELLPTASPAQAWRLLFGLLPALVLAAGGAAALLAAMAAVRGSAGAACAAVAAAAGTTAESGPPAAGAMLSMEALQEWLLAPAAGRCGDSGGAAGAAAVAMSMVLGCRAAVAALRAAAAAEAAAATNASVPSLLPAVADRCAAHLAQLASGLVAAAAAAPRPDGSAGTSAQALDAPAGGGSLEVAAVALVLLSELCGVAKAAEELAAPGNNSALDVWQAILLSVLQCLVAALTASAVPRQRTASASAAAAATAASSGASEAQQLLHSAVRVLRTLPSPTADMLLDSLERLCEEQESLVAGEERGQGGSRATAEGGWLSAALHAALGQNDAAGVQR